MRLQARKRFWAFLLITVALFTVYSAMGERGFINLHKRSRHRDELRLRIQNLKESNSKLAERIRLLRDDPDTIERLARTQLDMVRDGETIFILSGRQGEKAQ